MISSSSHDPFSAASAGNGVTVVLVDDDENFRRGLAENLREDGHTVHEYTMASQVPPFGTLGEVGVVVTDLEMPGKSGLIFADQVHAVHPGVPIILLTAHPAGGLVAAAASRSFLRLLYKPFEYSELQRLLHSL